MAEKVYCPSCKETEMHEVYFEESKSSLRCMTCNLVIDSHALQPP